MFQQRIAGIAGIKNPFVKRVGIDFVIEIFFKLLLLMTLEYHFSRFETLDQFIGIFAISFCCKKLTGRDVEKSQTKLFIFGKVNGGQEIIAMMFEQFIIDCGSRRYHISYPSFHNALCEFGIFQLITDGHPVTGFNQLM